MKDPLLIFVHGFMGSAESFRSMPADIENILKFESIQFEYESKGEYKQSLKKLSLFIQQQNRDIFILAHSMGGPLSIDAAKDSNSRFVKGILTIDSPFFGLDQSVTQAGANRGIDLVNKVSDYIPKTSSGWGMVALGLVGAIAAVNNPQVLKVVGSVLENHSREWIDRFAFLGPLWDVPNQETRFDFLTAPRPLFNFRGLYLQLSNGATFTKPPPPHLEKHFEIHRINAADQIEAHMNIFDPKTDSQAYDRIISNSVSIIRSWL